jgi:hypothetical protein
MKIFDNKPLYKTNLLQKITSHKNANNAIIELNNLLANHEPLAIKEEWIFEIEKKYKINLRKKFNSEVLQMYSEILSYYLSDSKISDVEQAELLHLKNILSLSDSEISHIHNKLTSEIYKSNYQNAVNDGNLTQEEENNLELLSKGLMLPDNLAKTISADVRSKKVDEFLKNAISDKRLSESESKELEMICKSLSVKLDFDSETQGMLERYRLFWLIENGEIPTIEVPIALQKSEQCYFTCDAEWHENKTITKRINYGGPTVSIKIMKGVYYRTGSIGVQRVTSQELVHIDSGKVYLTNKRIIFIGVRKSSNIRYEKILDLTPYSDGIEIIKDTGKPPIITMENEKAELFILILGRLISL